MNLKYFLLFFVFGFIFLCTTLSGFSQNKIENKSTLSIKQIMQWPHLWIGSSPENIFWSETGEVVYFDWNPEKEDFSSLYKYVLVTGKIERVGFKEKNALPFGRSETYSKDNSKKLYVKNGDLFLYNLSTKENFQITNTIQYESNPMFSINEKLVYFNKENNVYSWNAENGQIIQLSNFSTQLHKSKEKRSEQDEWLYKEQLNEFEVLADRKRKREIKDSIRESEKPQRPKTINIKGNYLSDLNISPGGKYITYSLSEPSKGNSTKMPDYVTESGYTQCRITRKKVGETRSNVDFYIYNLEKDTIFELNKAKFPGLNDKPAYFQEYPELNEKEYQGKLKYVSEPIWSDNGQNAVFETRSQDNKHRWIFTLNFESGETKILDHQHDDAWINGPGISYWKGNLGWLPDNKHVWFQSEESGYSHLYAVDIETGKKKALTKGKYEISNPFISKDKKYWYFTANKEHPGEKHFYKMPLGGGKLEKLTSPEGNHQVFLSPDETKMAIRYSFSNKPWELFLKDNSASAKAKQITYSTTDEFNAYNWRVPENITFKVRDGREVHARLYKPEEGVKNKAAVIFVHGAGYLQNAHKWWSSYFREYMFHNILTDNGYTVLDIDYAGSAGYGRNRRTLIYRHMGGKDLTDQTDGAKFLIKEHGIDAGKIGIYGGSYGGFISIFAMLKENETFTSAAAIRSVTNWAHYNHGYTSNILNTPVTDPKAYKRSSPMYFADGLKNNLLILHGMLDDNVHFQDVVLLQQRFIELGKENWEFVPYPMEAHGFKEPSSWTDEYKRIFKLFQTTIGKN